MCASHSFPAVLVCRFIFLQGAAFLGEFEHPCFFLVQPERCFHIIMCRVYLHLWNGKTQNNNRFIDLLLLFFFTKPPSSITLTQATCEDFSLHPSLYPQILQLSKKKRMYIQNKTLEPKSRH